MKEYINRTIKTLGLARVVIIAFFISLCIMALALNLNISQLVSSILVRVGMWGVLVLAMVPAINCGIGPNFGVSLGILCGLLGGLMAIEFQLNGFYAFFGAILFSLPFAILIGYLYGFLLNRVKGSEMAIATFVGFSAVSLMKIGWILLPFNNPEMAWPIGRGVRVTINLDNRELTEVLDGFLEFSIGRVTVPTGTLLLFAFFCFLVWLFMKSKTGLAMYASGSNPKFAEAAGIDVDKHRIIGTILSTVLGAVGILMFSQGYGFIQLYEAPMFMPIVTVAAVLIGGASIKSASILHVVMGTILFQGMLVVSMPVANAITSELASMGEISRIIIQNGIILYALAQVAPGGE